MFVSYALEINVVSIADVQINMRTIFGYKLHEVGFIKIQWNLLKDSNSIFLSFLKSWD
jgi:hypothetical protein